MVKIFTELQRAIAKKNQLGTKRNKNTDEAPIDFFKDVCN